MSFRKFIAVLAGLWLTAACGRADSAFTSVSSGLPVAGSSAIAWSEFNNDGKADVLITGLDASFNLMTRVCQNLGGNNFSSLPFALPGVANGAVAWGDFDNDHLQDFLLTGYAGMDNQSFPVFISQVWRNGGDGTFSNLNVNLPGVDNGAVAWGDFDNDGYPDFLLTGAAQSGGIAQIWHNNGNGTFRNLNIALPGIFYSSVALGDFDHDGNEDILLAGTPDGFASTALTQVWQNQGNNVFTNLNVPLPGIEQGVVAWGDFFNSGRLDILICGATSNGPITQIWRNLGGGAFSNINAGLPGVSKSSVALGDYDNDGNLDILLTGQDTNDNPTSQVWRNLGGGVFTNINAGLTGVYSGSAAWADFDNDGRLDILLTGYNVGSTPQALLYHNNLTGTNFPGPTITSFRPFGTNGYQFNFQGQVGLDIIVQASTNLPTWTTLGTANQTSPGTFRFIDREAAHLSQRYYRLSAP